MRKKVRISSCIITNGANLFLHHHQRLCSRSHNIFKQQSESDATSVIIMMASPYNSQSIPHKEASMSMLEEVFGGSMRSSTLRLHNTPDERDTDIDMKHESNKPFRKCRGSVEAAHDEMLKEETDAIEERKGRSRLHHSFPDVTIGTEFDEKPALTKMKARSDRSLRNVLRLPHHQSAEKKKPAPFHRHCGSVENIHMKLFTAEKNKLEREQQSQAYEEEEEVLEAYFLRANGSPLATPLVHHAAKPNSTTNKGVSLPSILHLNPLEEKNEPMSFQSYRGSMKRAHMQQSARKTLKEVEQQQPTKSKRMSIRSLMPRSKSEKQKAHDDFHGHRGNSLEPIESMQRSVSENHRAGNAFVF
jgi:hypothetical protein